ncbi:MAG: hypothetical protein HY718_17550 [Planctomycetes bacterium]|nr:hypothetical protein [Planctomycetota bacterium]
MATSVYNDSYVSPQVLGFSVAGAAASPGGEISYEAVRLHDRDDHRQSQRRALHCNMLLIEPGGLETDGSGVVPGECLNVGDGGLYGTVPLCYGVGLGQHYTVRLMVDERGPEPGAMQVVSQQGKIVRTELLMGRDRGEDRLGIAVKLYGHRSGVLPMPVWV